MDLTGTPITTLSPQIHPDLFWYYVAMLIALVVLYMAHLKAASMRMPLLMALQYWWLLWTKKPDGR